ncbi:GNAT family N-acetyltransferase [Anoxynatronum sibiricum]|uniref:GNAT family N-acetyltransferase n=1 Tax=Anoxynatronum sibiricum TaxID=210623 RepID=A0ABU9VUV7_9CLOT
MSPGKLVFIIKTEGIEGILRRILGRVYLRTHVYRVKLKHVAPVPGDEGLKLSEMNHRLFQRMIQAYPDEILPEKLDKLAERLKKETKERVYVVMDAAEQILGYYCLAFRETYDESMEYLVPDEAGNVFLFDGYTFKQHRNRGAQKYATQALLELGKKKGCDTASTMVDEGNRFSEKAIRRYGFRRYQTIHHIDLRFKKINMVRTWEDDA